MSWKEASKSDPIFVEFSWNSSNFPWLGFPRFILWIKKHPLISLPPPIYIHPSFSVFVSFTKWPKEMTFGNCQKFRQKPGEILKVRKPKESKETVLNLVPFKEWWNTVINLDEVIFTYGFQISLGFCRCTSHVIQPSALVNQNIHLQNTKVECKWVCCAHKGHTCVYGHLKGRRIVIQKPALPNPVEKCFWRVKAALHEARGGSSATTTTRTWLHLTARPKTHTHTHKSESMSDRTTAAFGTNSSLQVPFRGQARLKAQHQTGGRGHLIFNRTACNVKDEVAIDLVIVIGCDIQLLRIAEEIGNDSQKELTLCCCDIKG